LASHLLVHDVIMDIVKGQYIYQAII
jgi:hypothetical protein